MIVHAHSAMCGSLVGVHRSRSSWPRIRCSASVPTSVGAGEQRAPGL